MRTFLFRPAAASNTRSAFPWTDDYELWLEFGPPWACVRRIEGADRACSSEWGHRRIRCRFDGRSLDSRSRAPVWVNEANTMRSIAVSARAPAASFNEGRFSRGHYVLSGNSSARRSRVPVVPVLFALVSGAKPISLCTWYFLSASSWSMFCFLPWSSRRCSCYSVGRLTCVEHGLPPNDRCAARVSAGQL